MKASILKPWLDFRSCSKSALWTTLALSVTLFFSGCGGAGNNSTGATVAGKVTVNGKAPAGSAMQITFLGTGDKKWSSVISEDGNYTIMEAPVGPVKVTVTGSPRGAGMPGAPQPPAGDPIPANYANPDNGLTYDVKPGKQTKNFELTGS